MTATVNQRQILRRGRVFDFTLENVTLDNGVELEMEIIRHPGAAAIIALTDDQHIIMLKQYRHAVAAALWRYRQEQLNTGKIHFPALRENLRKKPVTVPGNGSRWVAWCPCQGTQMRK